MGDRQFVARGRVGCGRNVGVARCELARAAGDRHRIARAVSQQHPDAGRLKHGAAVAGAEGKVVATDLSPEMLAYGRERTAAAGLGNVEFVESQAASLNFPPESFDAALSRFGIIFEPEAEAAAARVRGFLVPGSRMVSARGDRRSGHVGQVEHVQDASHQQHRVPDDAEDRDRARDQPRSIQQGGQHAIGVPLSREVCVLRTPGTVMATTLNQEPKP